MGLNVKKLMDKHCKTCRTKVPPDSGISQKRGTVSSTILLFEGASFKFLKHSIMVESVALLL
jgi:hypothetical protein